LITILLYTALGFHAFQTQPWNVHSIYQQAFKVNPAATSALQAVVQAQQHVAEIDAQRRMALTFSGSASANRGTENFDPRSANFQTYQGTVSLPIPNGRRISAQEVQANAQLTVAQAGLTKAELDLAFRSSDAYFGILRARGAEAIAQQNLDQASRAVADAQKRVDAGDLAPSEVLKARVPESQARAALARAKSDVRVAEETLNSLIHLDLTGVPQVDELSEASAAELTIAQAHEEARKHSPDAITAEANVVAAQGALAETKRSRDMDFTLQASQTHTTDPTTYADLTTFGLSFNLPMSDGGVVKRQIAEATAALKQAEAARDTAYEDLDLAVEQAFLDVQADAANLASTKETLAIAQDSYSKAEEAYNAGLTTTRDVLDAGIALAQAKNDVNSATYDLALARAKLDQVIGRLPNS